MKAKITSIQYDTDEESIPNLPSVLEVVIPEDIEEDEVQDYLSDEISNITGFCHFGFNYEILKDLGHE